MFGDELSNLIHHTLIRRLEPPTDRISQHLLDERSRERVATLFEDGLEVGRSLELLAGRQRSGGVDRRTCRPSLARRRPRRNFPGRSRAGPACRGRRRRTGRPDASPDALGASRRESPPASSLSSGTSGGGGGGGVPRIASSTHLPRFTGEVRVGFEVIGQDARLGQQPAPSAIRRQGDLAELLALRRRDPVMLRQSSVEVRPVGVEELQEAPVGLHDLAGSTGPFR